MPARNVRPRRDLSRRALLGGAAIALGCIALKPSPLAAAEEARAIPAPTVDEPAASGDTTRTAVLAGGCFWGVQGVFQHVEGVSGAVSGYAGGEERTASYAQVSRGTTGHAEAVRVTFDPRQISYATILRIFFSVAHNPTERDRQGPDVGPQYRSVVFPTTPEQAATAAAYIAQLDGAGVFAAKIATGIAPGKAFYAAEAYHQDFMTRHPADPYVVYHDLPKLENLKRLFPALYRAEPVLVASAKDAGG
jgi:peptide-methionine (S)-S-oxide reductase